MVRGDFNGDQRGDLAVILIAVQARRSPRLAVFEERASGHVLAHSGQLDEMDDVVIDVPQEVLLRLVKQGEEWAPEAGDVPKSYAHAFDAIELASWKKSVGGAVDNRLHLVYWNGKRYAES
jgi:hypothetical protein